MSDDALRAAAFEFSPQSAVLVDAAHGRILGCNRAFSILLGYSEEELIDRRLDVILPVRARDAMYDALEATRTSPLLAHETTLPLRREDETEVSVRVRCRWIDEGATMGDRAVITVDELLASPDSRDAFFSMLAHELRNRLSNLRLAVQILRREPEPYGSRWPWGLQVMEQQVGGISTLIDDLLDVSRMARGRLTLKREPVEVSKAVDTAVERWRARQDDRPPQVDAHVNTSDAMVAGETDRLIQIVDRLLELASAGQEPLSVKTFEEGREVAVVVGGPGLKPGAFSNDLDLFAAAARA
ncbi:MAG: PAS domain-containing sensor histidine kinase, partial [Myxococcota bacterium]